MLSFGANPKYTGLTATASDGTSPLTALFDGNYGGGRQMTNIDNVDVVVNLGSIKSVGSIRIYWEAANAKAYNILTSDDNISWTSQSSFTNLAAGSRTDIITLNVSCQYIKMQGVTRQLPYGYNIWEFEVFPSYIPTLTTLVVTPSSTSITLGQTKQYSVSGLDQTSYPISLTNSTSWSVNGSGASIDGNGLFSSTNRSLFTVTATNSSISKTATIDVLPSNTNLSYVTGVKNTATASSVNQAASNAFDNNAGTRWETAASDPQWIKVDLGSVKTITDIVISWEFASAKDYIIETSTDDINYTTAITKTNMASGARTDRMYDVSFTGRYIRLTGTARTSAYGYSIYEFQIYGSSLITPNLTFATPTSVSKNYGDAAFTNLATSSNSAGAITYSSGNTGIATVDANTGQVSIISAGSSVITATIAANGGYSSTTATYTLTVAGITPTLTFATPTSVSKDYGDAAFTNTASSSNSLGVVTYSSGNTSVATVNSATGQVTINAAGSAVITATIAAHLGYTSTTATYTLTVAGVTPNFTLATSGTINKKLGNAPFTNAASSSNSAGAISYESNNTGVATVNSSTGEVTVVGIGTAVITATIAANGAYTSQTATYTIIVKYLIGSIKATNVPLYAQGTNPIFGGDINNPVNTSFAVLDYKLVTENGKSWAYTKFTGTSALDLGAPWTTQLRYWSVANAKTESNLVSSRNGTTKIVLGSTTSSIPSSCRISFFQALNPGGYGESLLTSYSPTANNSVVEGDVTSPVVTACSVAANETSATLLIAGTDNSGDLFYKIEDEAHGINEFAFTSNYTLLSLIQNTTYNISITPIDFNGNEGASFSKQFTCNGTVIISSNVAISAIAACPTCNLTIDASGELTVDATTTLQTISVSAGGKLSVQATKTLTANSITLNSDATGTATFVDNGTATITTATVQQYIPQGRNWYITSPVVDGTAGALNTGTEVRAYNETTKVWDVVTGNLTQGRGYISVSNSGSGTSNVSFSGTLNTGTITVPLTRSGSTKPGFNLVGNPYPSYLDWSLVSAANPDVATTMWFRTKTSGGAYTFSTYNTSGNVAVANGASTTITKYIPPMQAFWVRVNADKTTTDFSMTNTMRSHADVSGNRFKAPVQSAQKLVRLEITNGVNIDEAVLYFNENAIDGFDNYDSQKMINGVASMPEIYTKADNQQLVINGMQKITENSQYALGYTTGVAGVLKLKVTELDNFDATTKAYLIDKLENTETELTTSTEYNFNSSITTNNESRFSLQFRAPGATTSVGTVGKPTIQVFVNAANRIVIIAAEKSNFAIYNAVGQLIENGIMNMKRETRNAKLNAGVYVVKINNQTTRVIVK